MKRWLLGAMVVSLSAATGTLGGATGTLGAAAWAMGGTDTGNGGDAIAQEFQSWATLIVNTLEQDESAREAIPEVDAGRLLAVIKLTEVTTLNHVFLNGVEKDGRNIPTEHRIEVGRVRWQSYKAPQRIGLVLHEYLELMAMENEGYQISNRFRIWLNTHGMKQTDDDRKSWEGCENQAGGAWQIGHSGFACDSSAYLPDAVTLRTYYDFIYYEGGDDQKETRRYMTKMVGLVNEVAALYLSSRRSASSAEIQAWSRLVAAIVQSESLWSHYRLANDHRLKIGRADAGHGYGLMMIDDRSHRGSVVANTDLVHNLAYAMDILYAEWEAAANAHCVSGPANWRDRSRSAYSAFNGGAGALCRWTTHSPFTRNDQTFVANFDGQAWLTYVDDPHAKSGLDLGCLLQKSAADCLQ